MAQFLRKSEKFFFLILNQNKDGGLLKEAKNIKEVMKKREGERSRFVYELAKNER